MTKIALTAAAVLIATGFAFAGSDNYGSNAGQPASVDSMITSSVQKSDVRIQKPLILGSDRNLFGR